LGSGVRHSGQAAPRAAMLGHGYYDFEIGWALSSRDKGFGSCRPFITSPKNGKGWTARTKFVALAIGGRARDPCAGITSH
jgi:hypothetical protein